MRTINFSVSICRHCGHYQPQKGWGGHCQQLGVAVQGKWKACPLGISPFATYAEHLDGVDCGLMHR
ncbi:hypothetical protein MC7420_627 [Coleofasciculus chthonoplastes PCC 7420]|uniref:Uncharacterized protein n=1 Tax=Coleofasciculus chthonoplastes PCC 7420 TaxID=118168 RepID=B4VKV7_9CYAN|nr:hypothetical protein [Coleofasciculus chthonoplastes]EDX77490.1 hypothetical protein MC7420_627 [Coleofasciculus chthonoplastes PCC 7420]